MKLKEDFINNISKIFALTKEGKIHWERLSGSTFFSQPTEDSGIYVRKVLQPDKSSIYSFQLVQLPNTDIFTAQSGDNDYKALLKDLFELLEYNFEKNKLDFFDNVIKKFE